MKQITSTQEFMNVLDIRDDIIITQNPTQYVKLMEFSPINFELRSPSEQDAIISQFSSALRTFPRNTHIKIINTPSDVSSFIKDLRKKQAEEEQPECRAMQESQIEMLQKVSKTQGVTRRFFISFPYETSGGFRTSPTFNEIQSTLFKQGRSIQAALEACGNSTLSYESKEYTLSALYACICKAQSEAEPWDQHLSRIVEKYKEKFGEDVNLDRIPVTDFFAPEQIDSSYSPNYTIIDGKYVTYCYIPSNAYPTQAVGGWLSIFFSYIDDVSVDFWIKKEDPEMIQRRLQFELKNNRIKSRNIDEVSLDYDDLMNTLDAGYYIKQSIANGDDYCNMATMITIYGNSLDDMNDKFNEMREFLIRQDMALKRCTLQMDEAFRSALPFAGYNKKIFAKSKRNVMASQLGSCYPFTAYELCEKGGVFLGLNEAYGSPVFVNNFDTARYQNANMMIFGPSGSGKTYTLMCMLLRMRQQGTQIFVVAPLKGFEFKRACEAIGGEFIQIAPGQPQNINIMEIRKKDTAASDLIDGNTDSTRGSVLVAKIQQLHRFFSIIVPDMTATEKQVLDDALVRTYGNFGITHRNKSLIDPNKNGEYKKMPVLGDLHKELNNAGDDGKRLYNLLTRFVTGSARSFNQPTNVNLDNKFIVVDVSQLTDELLPMGMFIALDYILDKAEQDRTKRKVIAIDEMWKLMKASQLSAEFVVEVFKIIRGYAGSAVGATQDLGDVLANEYGAAIINNSKTKLLLPMDKKEAEAVSKVIDLTSEEMKKLKRTEMTVAAGTQKRRASNVLMVANTNHIFIKIKASKTEHDLITTSADDLAAQARRNAQLAAEHN